jgi:hypothetical protein
VLFDPQPKARADLTPGTLYAIDGGAGWIYYGQVAPDRRIGFFRHRTVEMAAPADVLVRPLMSRVIVVSSSIGHALRSGHWRKMGRHDLHPDLLQSCATVQWPVGTLTVTVWINGRPSHNTRVEDPAIQDLEIIAWWDAIAHIPARLVADYGAEPAGYIGGPIWRERRLKEELARRFPDAPWHQLPADWVPVTH